MTLRFSTSHRVMASFALATTTVIATMGLTAFEINRAIDDQRWVAHTYQVLRALDDMTGALGLAEAAQRAYLLTGDSDRFAARDNAISWAESLYIDIAELTRDNPLQQSRLAGLEEALRVKIDAMNDLMAAGPDSPREDIQRRLRQEDSQTAEIISRTTRMREEENRILLLRNANAEHDLFIIPAAMLAAFALFLATEAAFFVRIRHDIRERERAEAEARAARKTAEDATRAKSEFLANMSHEIRTPLNAIMGLTHLVLESDLAAGQRENLLKVSRSSLALRNLLNDILDYSKIEAGRMDIEWRDIAVEDIVTGVSDLFGPAAEEKGLALHIEIAPDAPQRFMGDELRIGQVLSNLVGNAIKFTQAGEIRIAVARTHEAGSDRLEFSVSDTGAGIAPEIQDHLFSPFTQADSSISRRYGGTGLGLAICRRLVTLMNGAIGVSSEVGRGSRFYFSLPLSGIESGAAGPDLSEVRALVVDDQPTAAQIACVAIRARNGRATPLTESNRIIERLEEAADSGAPFNLVILDWHMPEPDGITCAAFIEDWARTSGRTPPVTIMMMTAYGRDRLMQAAQGVHLDAVLSKPILPSTLHRAIRAAMHPEEAGDAPRLGEKSGAGAALDGAQVLLVEDNALNQEVAAKLLQRWGIEVVVAANGPQAIDFCGRMKFGTILMDLHMPGMDGLQTTRRIRAIPGCESVPIIALTAAVLPEEQRACREAGMNDHVAKPIIPAELHAALARWIKLSERPAGPATAEFPEIPGIDRTSLAARLDGDRILLHSLLRQFLANSATAAAEIRLAAVRHAHREVAHLAHTLAGVSGNLSAVEVSKLSRTIETMAAEKIPPDLDRQIDALDRSLQALAGNIERYLRSLPKEAPRSGPETAGLDGLIDCLEREDFDALEQFADLREALERRHGAALARVSDAIAGLRFSEALALLRELEAVD